MIVNFRERLNTLREAAIQNIKNRAVGRELTTGDGVLATLAAVQGVLAEAEQLELRRGHLLALLFELLTGAPNTVIDARFKAIGVKPPLGFLLNTEPERVKIVLLLGMQLKILPMVEISTILGGAPGGVG